MGSSFLTLLVSFFACSGSGPIAVPMLPIISRVASFMSAHSATCLRNAAACVRAGRSSWLPDFRRLGRNPARVGITSSGISQPRDNMDGAIKTVAVPPNYQ
jgi:hypothetical protein